MSNTGSIYIQLTGCALCMLHGVVERSQGSWLCSVDYEKKKRCFPQYLVLQMC